eukprot:TRINITY_DN95512_c0_g1_i1.p1 TRINITY_DN95512_c0_g1~~TRINITY_DN95512_c0_g1_i1.p1  ORF type:complete len:1078 (-),score=87.15 TRINITY_DN95512_c0_g1_i1:28-3261(-)
MFLVLIFSALISLTAGWAEESTTSRRVEERGPTLACPAVHPMEGAEARASCNERCSHNTDCALNEMCCFNGCGTDCLVAVPMEGCNKHCAPMKCHITTQQETCCDECEDGYRLRGCECERICEYDCDVCREFEDEYCCTKCKEGYEQHGCECREKPYCPPGCSDCIRALKPETHLAVIYNVPMFCTQCNDGWVLLPQGGKCVPANDCGAYCDTCHVQADEETCCDGCQEGYYLRNCRCEPKPDCPQTGCEECFDYNGYPCCATCSPGFELVGCHCMPSPPPCNPGCRVQSGAPQCYYVHGGQTCCENCQDGYDFDGCNCHHRPACPAHCDDCVHKIHGYGEMCCVHCEDGYMRDGCTCVPKPECYSDSDCPDKLFECCTGVCQEGKCIDRHLDCDDNDLCTVDYCNRGSCMHAPVVCQNENPACFEMTCNPETGKCDKWDNCVCHTKDGYECAHPTYELSLANRRWEGSYHGCIRHNGEEQPWCLLETAPGVYDKRSPCDMEDHSCKFQCTTTVATRGAPCQEVFTLDLHECANNIRVEGCIKGLQFRDQTSTYGRAWCPLYDTHLTNEQAYSSPRGECNDQCKIARGNDHLVHLEVSTKIPAATNSHRLANEDIMGRVMTTVDQVTGLVWLAHPTSIILVAPEEADYSEAHLSEEIQCSIFQAGFDFGAEYDNVRITALHAYDGVLVVGITVMYEGEVTKTIFADFTATLNEITFRQEYTAFGGQNDGAIQQVWTDGNSRMAVFQTSLLFQRFFGAVASWSSSSLAGNPPQNAGAPGHTAAIYDVVDRDTISHVDMGRDTTHWFVSLRGPSLVVSLRFDVTPNTFSIASIWGVPATDHSEVPLAAPWTVDEEGQNQVMNYIHIMKQEGVYSLAGTREVCYLNLGPTPTGPDGLIYTMDFMSGSPYRNINTKDDLILDAYLDGGRGFHTASYRGHNFIQEENHTGAALELLQSTFSPEVFNGHLEHDFAANTVRLNVKGTTPSGGPRPANCHISADKSTLFVMHGEYPTLTAWSLANPAKPQFAGTINLDFAMGHVWSLEEIPNTNNTSGTILIATSELTGESRIIRSYPYGANTTV